MGKEDNTIRIAPERIEESISLLKDLKERLRALDADKDKLQGDCGCVSGKMQEYDRTLTMVIAQMKTLITFTVSFLQKANSTFAETDRRISKGM